jgi:L-threonylcarbamoyladenylate synthase
VAAGLYAALRRFDELDVDLILAEGLEDSGVGLAVMNRLRKAADRRIVAGSPVSFNGKQP